MLAKLSTSYTESKQEMERKIENVISKKKKKKTSSKYCAYCNVEINRKVNNHPNVLFVSTNFCDPANVSIPDSFFLGTIRYELSAIICYSESRSHFWAEAKDIYYGGQKRRGLYKLGAL